MDFSNSALNAGRFGSGKTFMLLAMLGGCRFIEGKTCSAVSEVMDPGARVTASGNWDRIPTGVAYVPQTAWLQSQSIRGNILDKGFLWSHARASDETSQTLPSVLEKTIRQASNSAPGSSQLTDALINSADLELEGDESVQQASIFILVISERRLGPDYGAADPSPREGADPDSIEALPTNVLIQVNAALEFLSEPEDPPSA